MIAAPSSETRKLPSSPFHQLPKSSRAETEDLGDHRPGGEGEQATAGQCDEELLSRHCGRTRVEIVLTPSQLILIA